MPMRYNRRLLAMAIGLEAALGVAGLVLIRALDLPLKSRLDVSPGVAVRTLAALAPMAVLLWFALYTNIAPLVRLREQVEELVGQLFAGVPGWGLAAVAVAAGAGEELLFRGALQPLAERLLGPAAGWAAASILFGALHAVSGVYFLLATLVGAYLGWLAAHFDDLIAPIAVHAIYDFAALVLLARRSATAQTLGSEHRNEKQSD